MSDYEKPVKKCQDAPLGFRTVNSIAESQDAQRELLQLEHDPIPSPAPPPFLGGGGSDFVLVDPVEGGAHNTPKVARGVIGLEIDPNLYAFSSPIINTRYRTGVCQDFIRTALGVYYFPISGLSDCYGEALPIDTYSSGTLRCCQVTPTGTVTVSTATQQFTSPGLFVSCWEETALEAGALGFALADFSFDLVVYGNRTTDLSESLVPFVSSPAWVRRRADVRRAPRSVVVKPF